MPRTTLKEVADAVGLDISTVSRVLNRPEKARVSDGTRERVIGVASDLGYRPNATAQALARGRTGAVGILVPDYLDAVYMRYVEGLSRFFEREGSLVVPMATHFRADMECRCLDILNGGRADIALALRYEAGNLSHYDCLRGSGFPIVFRIPDDDRTEIPFDAVLVDVSSGFGVLAAHFASMGRVRIGIVGGFAARELRGGRFDSASVRAFASACGSHGLAVGRFSAVVCEPDAGSARDAVLSSLSRAPGRFDALIVQSNRLLPGVCSALRRHGLRVPGDVALAVISDSEFCQVADMSLTVWAQPVDRICAELFRLARQRLADPERGVEHVRIGSTLIHYENRDSGDRMPGNRAPEHSMIPCEPG